MYRIERWGGQGKPDPEKLKQEMESEGYRVYQWSDAPGMFYTKHCHAENQSHWVISGTIEMTVEPEGTFTLESGDRDFMPGETYHSARIISKEGATYLIGEKTCEKV